jgi:hypothetical protein
MSVAAIARRIQSLVEETAVTSGAGTVATSAAVTAPQHYRLVATEVETPATAGSTIRSIAAGLLIGTGRLQTGLEERLEGTR